MAFGRSPLRNKACPSIKSASALFGSAVTTFPNSSIDLSVSPACFAMIPSRYHTSTRFGSRSEGFGVVRFKMHGALKRLDCFRKSRLTGKDQAKVDKRLSVLRIVLDCLPE